MSGPLGWRLRRYAAVLVWVPLIVVFPLLDLHGGAWQRVGQVALVALIAAAALTAVLTTERRNAVAVAAVLVLFAGAVVASTQGAGWMPCWTLAVITAPVVLRGWWLAVAVGAAPVLYAVTATLTDNAGDALWVSVGGVLLAGLATTAFLRLVEANEALRCTREELARVAVAEERERFSRDLHDLLGHTLSVMVVKAQAVRRLAGRDDAAVVEHATDIESVGRGALVQVREAVDAMRAPSLADAVADARRAFAAAGIATRVEGFGAPVPEEVDRALGWVVREAATNVLRHSGAESCRLAVSTGPGELCLEIADDGVGGPPLPDGVRRGGLDGLRRRLLALGGELDAGPGPDGFRLTARVPVGGRG